MSARSIGLAAAILSISYLVFHPPCAHGESEDIVVKKTEQKSAPATDSAGREYKFVSAPLSPGLEAAQFELWIPNSIPDDQPVRGLLCASAYHAGTQLYADAQWRGLAQKLNCACLRYRIPMRAAEQNPGKEDLGDLGVQPLLAALVDFARQAKRPELEHAGLVVTGLSRAGWQAVALAAAMPDRVIAAVPFHEATPIHAHELFEKAAGHAVPQLHVMGGKCFLTPYVQPWVLEARAQGALWTTCLQPNVGHSDMGDLTFVLAWVEAVVRLRVPAKIPAGKPYRLTTLKEEEGRFGVLKIKVDGNFVAYDSLAPGPGGAGTDRGKQVTSPKTSTVERAALVETGGKSEAVWLPNEAIAKAWLDYHKAGPRRP